MIITLAGGKGGVGKSTIAVSVAACLAEDYKVGLLDADPQGTVDKWGSRRQKNNITNIEIKHSTGDIHDIIEAMAKRSDIVIVDTAGFDSRELRTALVLSDIAICPFRATQFEQESCIELISTIKLAKAINKNLKVHALINCAPTQHNDSRANDATGYLSSKGLNVLRSRVYSRLAWSDCTATGLGVSEFTDGKARMEVKNIVKEILL